VTTAQLIAGKVINAVNAKGHKDVPLVFRVPSKLVVQICECLEKDSDYDLNYGGDICGSRRHCTLYVYPYPEDRNMIPGDIHARC
jgi:hypothetical protein